ncbi:MAG: tryptophan synthase subunit alpha [Actinomycetota bacterium]|nr:tryptophan synthase subunit alpha [Actinomycetota bacterium]MDZ4180302.1 tryptophan synthase subunit alpha [Coriobacteriia bacterium]
MADDSPLSVAGLAPAFAKDRSALVVYLMAGYPDAERSLAAMRAAAASGADLIELGVPYGDALADGPVIARAAGDAMRSNPGGFGLAEAIDLAATFITDPGVDDPPPVALMTYINPILRMGYTETAARMRAAGIAGVIVPDMPPDVASAWLCAASGLDTVFLAAPTSTPERLAKVGEMSDGFVYAVSTTGITGERDRLSDAIPALVKRVRAFTKLPVAVGFGISTPEQAAEIAAFADGVIVGSACVKRQPDAEELGDFVSQLARAVHGERG